MKSLVTALMLLCFCLSVMIGCTSHSAREDESHARVSNLQQEAEIMSEVFRFMGDNSRTTVCVIAAPDNIYRLIEEHFKNNPPKFSFRQARKDDSTFLSVSVLRSSGNRAAAAGSYNSASSFSTFKFHLVHADGRWRIQSHEFEMAS